MARRQPVGRTLRVRDCSRPQPGSAVVLITQCVQNDLFLNRDCRLRLPDTIVPRMLLGNRDFDIHAGGNGRE